MVAEYERNSPKLKGLFQAIGAVSTPDMLLMAWRVIQGMEIKDLSISYQSQLGEISMLVVLGSPYGDGQERYESPSVGDIRFQRHVGVLEVNGIPILDGFYPLRADAPARATT